MLIANARMYSTPGPAAKQAWKDILAWTTGRAGVPMDIIDHDPPALLSTLWSRDDLGATMMCGLPMAMREPLPVVIAAPIPSPARYGGRAVYFSDILVPADSPATTIEETFGGTVGYTLTDSMSGCVALRVLLEQYRTPDRPQLYAKVVGDLIHVRGMVEAVGTRRVDVGAADSYLFDLIRKHDPAFAAQVKVIGTTSAAPMPPFVATGSLAPGPLASLQEAFRAVAGAAELAQAREHLLLTGFEIPDAAVYDVFHGIRRIAERHADVW